MRREETSARRSARWPDCVKRSLMPTVASIVLLALCCAGCASSRKTSLASQTGEVAQARVTRLADSVERVTIKRLEPVSVPESRVKLMIAADSLLSTPLGASWTGRSGQANVKVQRQAGTAGKPEVIVVEATCDSLQLQCERYEETIAKQRRAIDALSEAGYRLYREQLEEVKEKPPNGIRTALKWLFIGIIIGLLMGRIKTISRFIKQV